ncbi:MAG TPA: error-prone DNA polymerase [Polyangia bacterium]|nr:error-prone DNA polymerase [Polyangia bacterium]
MPAETDYVELRCRSAFSFLDGASPPEELIAAAARQEMGVLALADRDGVYGAPRFAAAAQRAGIRPLTGAEVTLCDGPPVLLLVATAAGYRHLCRLLTRAREGLGKADPPRATRALLAEHAEGLVALAGPTPRDDLADLCAAFGRGNVYLELQRHFDAREAWNERAVTAQAESLGVGLVATNDVRYATPRERVVHDVLTCTRAKCTVDEIGRRLAPNGERWLKPPGEMTALFADRPSALRATREIADRCRFSLADLGYTFPKYPVPAGETEQTYLERLCAAAVSRRYGPADDPWLPKVRAQLARELQIIGRLGLGGYFLLVWDIVEEARRRNIMIQGRGSAANSAVCFVLGITAVDPVKMELLFERFLSEERVGNAGNMADRMPDIDLDLPSGDAREQMIQHVYATYGRTGAAMTANVITYRPRMAVRDAGRAMGFSEEQLSRISTHLPGWTADEGRTLTDYFEMAGFSPRERRTRLAARAAAGLLNLPRHLGQHSGGMVLCGGRLDEVVPLEPAAMPGRVVVQWDKDDCADMGLVKVDLLGLGMMAVLADAFPLVRRHEGIDLDCARLPPDDPKVYDMLCAADTVGVFQVESRAQMATLPRMKPRKFYDLVVEVAIIRPGPIVGKMLNPYLERRAGRALITYPHPSLEPVLARTLGIPLFQEQLIRMAMLAAGFSGGQADELRRAMGFKRSIERMNVIEKDLRAGMTANGIVGAAQEEIVQGVKSFALYGFPESHAASFALIAYASAYLKAHHPAAFLAALLNNWPLGFYHPSTLVTDAARHGVVCKPIDVTASGWLADLEDGGRAVRLGLRAVSGFGEAFGRRVEAARRAAPFTSLADFARRTDASDGELERLAEIGAFAALGGTRRAALWQVEALGRSGELHRRGSQAEALPPSPLPEMSAEEELAADYAGTNLTIGPHPVAFLRPALDRRGITRAADLGAVPQGRRARVAGVVIVRQRPGTAKGFVFITVEDETGFANAIVTPDRFEQDRQVILGVTALIIEGVVQNQDGVVSIKADRFEPLGGGAGTVDVSHDFH